MTSTILSICFSLLFLTIVIRGDHHDQLAEKLNQMARDNELINGEFRPLENGIIKRTKHSAVFKGERKSDNLKVAMKFTRKEHKSETDKEYEMYTHLDAIELSQEIEKFGFSGVHYYNEWDEYMVIVFSRFEGDLIDALHGGRFNSSLETGAVNSLILFRNFVRQSKYMHAHGVRHNDVEPENIMLRKHQSFLIDFDLSAKMSEENKRGPLQYASRRCHKGQLRNALDDWESFLYTMCKINKVQLKWFSRKVFKGLKPREAFELCGQMKDNIAETIEQIEATIKSAALRSVYLAFANEAFDEHNFLPNYNRMDEFITNEIERVLNPSGVVTAAKNLSAPLFTWLNYADRIEAQNFLKKFSIRLMAKHILDPPTDFDAFHYSDVRYDYFSQSNERLARQKSDTILSRLAKIVTLCDSNLIDN